MQNIKAIFIAIFLLSGLSLHTQDYHFSQFETAPLHLNPALAGLMEGNHRLSVKYRDQWTSVLRERAYKTGFMSYDFQICANNGDFFAFGASALYDQAGTHVYRTFQGNLNLAYHHELDQGTYLAMGVQAGTMWYGLGGRDFRFDEQFGPNGYDPNLDDFEDFERFTTNKMLDINTGILYHNTRRNVQLGISAFHINQPSYSFLGLDNKNDSRVHMRVVFHGSIRWEVAKYDHLVFRPLAMVQKPAPGIMYWQIVPAAQWHHHMNIVKTGLIFGVGARITKNDAAGRPILDSGILTATIDLDPLMIGFSYEINLSPLVAASNFRTGPEVSMTYMFGQKSECVVCRPGFK